MTVFPATKCASLSSLHDVWVAAWSCNNWLDWFGRNQKYAGCSLGLTWPRDHNRMRHPHWLSHGFSTFSSKMRHNSLHKAGGFFIFFPLLIHLFLPPQPFPPVPPCPPSSQYTINDFRDHFPLYAPLVWMYGDPKKTKSTADGTALKQRLLCSDIVIFWHITSLTYFKWHVVS